MRGLLGFRGFAPWLATLIHFATVWTTALVMLPGLGAAPPVSKRGAKAIALDLFHHATYATATGFAYELITR